MRRALTLALTCLLLAAPALADTAESVLRDALAQRHAQSFAGGELRLALDGQQPGPVKAVQALRFDPATGRFAAILLRDADRVRVTGEAWAEVQAAMPARPLPPGTVIQAEDLSRQPLRLDRGGGAVLTDAEVLVGMQVKRALTPGRPIPASAVTSPALVRRNKPVALEYRSGPLLLAAKGRALEDAGLGEMVRVQNLDSGKTITGTVRGPGLVSANP